MWHDEGNCKTGSDKEQDKDAAGLGTKG